MGAQCIPLHSCLALFRCIATLQNGIMEAGGALPEGGVEHLQVYFMKSLVSYQPYFLN